MFSIMMTIGIISDLSCGVICTNDLNASLVKRVEDIMKSRRRLLQSSATKVEFCSPFHTEMKYEGNFQYCKQCDGQNVRFVCCECEFQARIEDVVRSHVRLHSTQFGEADCFYSCNICHYNTEFAVQLEFHIKTCHKDKLDKEKMEVKKQEETQKEEDDDSNKDYSDVELISNAEVIFDDGSTTATASASVITENEEISNNQTNLKKHKQTQTLQ